MSFFRGSARDEAGISTAGVSRPVNGLGDSLVSGRQDIQSIPGNPGHVAVP